mmetsp:Transcript_127649/g.272180  ORF Transcript_127649/g.272180 Transcript_127649/m.272180 type:complete len:376 (+) Transcript_127649:69-1196(+)
MLWGLLAVPILAVLTQLKWSHISEYSNSCAGRDAEDVTEAINDTASLADVHVVYAADAGSFGGLLPSMVSLTRHIGTPGRCVIHVIVPRSDMIQARGLLDCFRHESAESTPSVVLHEFRPLPFDTTTFWTLGGTTHPLTYSRYFLDEYMPGVPRAIWLDTDTIVKADLGPLYRMPMKHMIAATLDTRSSLFEPFRFLWGSEYLDRSHGISETGLIQDWTQRMFTCGVMVFDLEQWNASDVKRDLIALTQTFKGFHGDQLPLNIRFQGQVDRLSPRWNILLSWWAFRRYPQRCCEEAWILHLTSVKYWHDMQFIRDFALLWRPLVDQYLPKQQCASLGNVSYVGLDRPAGFPSVLSTLPDSMARFCASLLLEFSLA